MSPPAANQHGTAILFGDAGILIRGPARAGKSALAFSALRRAELLRLPAFLVADDQVLVEVAAGRLVARAPDATRGLIEVSGIGILREPWTAQATLTLVVDLLDPAGIERLPEQSETTLLGVALARIVLPARQAAFGADVLQGIAGGAAPPQR